MEAFVGVHQWCKSPKADKIAEHMRDIMWYSVCTDVCKHVLLYLSALYRDCVVLSEAWQPLYFNWCEVWRGVLESLEVAETLM